MRSVGVGHLRPVHSNIPPLCLIPHSERDGAGGPVLSLSTSFQWIALLRVCLQPSSSLVRQEAEEACLLQFYCRAPSFTTCKRLYLQHHRESSFTRTISSLLIREAIIPIPRSAGKSFGQNIFYINKIQERIVLHRLLKTHFPLFFILFSLQLHSPQLLQLFTKSLIACSLNFV